MQPKTFVQVKPAYCSMCVSETNITQQYCVREICPIQQMLRSHTVPDHSFSAGIQDKFVAHVAQDTPRDQNYVASAQKNCHEKRNKSHKQRDDNSGK